FFPEEDYANQYKITGILWHDATKKITIEQSPMGGQGFYRITAFLNGKSVIKLISEEGQAQSYSQKYYYLKNGTALVLIDQRRENNTITGKREVKPQHMNNIHKMILQEDMKWVQQALKYVFNEVDYPEFTKN
ncbi:MAG: hypothetical protein KAI79_15770, partial [Bacteroidales bacterium]|nr:hypothetical protein [Bacteroidales bacterium]